jgi:hypothetical protein
MRGVHNYSVYYIELRAKAEDYSTVQGRYAFEVEDWRGRLVRMTQRTFDAHVEKRAVTIDYLGEAKETISDPDIVQESDTGATYLYRFGIGRPPYSNLYLMVIIYYRQREGTQTGIVATYHFTDSLAYHEPVIEYRAQWVNGRRIRLQQGE